jgi:oxygen-independent coproporphyrinogen-3 oxidase
VYVHVPFCARRCTYCDFHIAVRRSIDAGAFADAIKNELSSGGRTLPTDGLETIYFGGGTPSRLGGTGITKLLSTLTASGMRTAAGAEITIEANPDDVSDDFASQVLAAGVNRVSLGIQSFDDRVLQWMHRVHTSEAAISAVASLRRAGVRNLSVDLIYALPDSLNRLWEADLERAIALRPEHVSVYGLTVEPGTPLGKWTASGRSTAAPDERAEGEFLLAHRALTAAGYEHYEVSNYALPGFRSRHNSAYWTRAPYLGVGPSAHSFDGVERRWNVPNYAAWTRSVAAGVGVVEGSERLSAEQVASETRYLGLRTTTGCAVSPAGAALAERWANEGWAELRDRWLTLTPQGWLRLDAIAAALETPEATFAGSA